MVLLRSFFMIIVLAYGNAQIMNFSPPEKNLQNVIRYLTDIRTNDAATRDNQENTGSEIPGAVRNKITEGYPADKRTKRAVLYLGTAMMRGWTAVRKLVYGGRLVAKNDKGVRTYLKPGGYTEAKKDFFSVDPKIIENSAVHKKGRVGDRIITVRKGAGGEPTSIAVTKTSFRKTSSDDKIDIIIYDD